MNAIVFNNECSIRYSEYIEEEQYKLYIENLSKKSEIWEERITGKGYYIKTVKDNKCYCLFVNETTNKKDAKHIAKYFIAALESAILFKNKQENISEQVDKIVLHNTKNINNSINLKLLPMVKGDALYQYSDKVSFIKDLINKNQSYYAKELLNLYKFANQIQFEYTMMLWLNPLTGKEYVNSARHKVYKIVELARFVSEDILIQRNITINIEQNDEYIICDFDILKSSLSQIFENCAKYCMEKSIVEVTFSKNVQNFIIDISMVSLYHDDEELGKIFLPGVRGRQVEKSGFKGSGIGLYIVRSLLGICNINVRLTRLPDGRIYEKEGLKYTNNMFVISIPNK
ncbi:MAG: ATP-binding protein [Rectinemataceae bacterium]